MWILGLKYFWQTLRMLAYSTKFEGEEKRTNPQDPAWIDDNMELNIPQL